jgi:hypothetical protein
MQTTPFIAGKRAIPIYPSNNTNIPFPQLIVSGTTKGVGTNQLIDTTQTFAYVMAGDIVYNTSAGSLASATVVRVEQAGIILLNANIFPTTPKEYTIYSSSNETINEGCIVYVGGTNANENIKVTTVSGDIVTFSNILLGSYIPCVVTKVWETGTSATNLLAIW